jgi:hypothetical protein
VGVDVHGPDDGGADVDGTEDVPLGAGLAARGPLVGIVVAGVVSVVGVSVNVSAVVVSSRNRMEVVPPAGVVVVIAGSRPLAI